MHCPQVGVAATSWLRGRGSGIKISIRLALNTSGWGGGRGGSSSLISSIGIVSSYIGRWGRVWRWVPMCSVAIMSRSSSSGGLPVRGRTAGQGSCVSAGILARVWGDTRGLSSNWTRGRGSHYDAWTARRNYRSRGRGFRCCCGSYDHTGVMWACWWGRSLFWRGSRRGGRRRRKIWKLVIRW